MTRQEEPRIIVAGPCGGVIPKAGERPVPELPLLARVLLAITGGTSRETWASQAVRGRLNRYAQAEARNLQRQADREAGA